MADNLGTYRQALVHMLQDRSNETWTDDELDAAIRLALADLSRQLPRDLSAEVVLAQSGRRLSLAAIEDCLWVEEVWWPYGEGVYPPPLVAFEVRQGWLQLHTAAEPAAGETVRLLYAGGHTIAGLDEATETTVPAEWRGVLTLGAAGYAAAAKSAAMAREYAWPTGAASTLGHWSEMMLALFQARLRALRRPAAQAWVTWG